MAESPAKRDWGDVPMSPEAQKCYDEVYLPRIRALQKEIETTPLVVLVWGPGSGACELYQKRLQIRGVLREQGIAAVFSEEISFSGKENSEKANELLEAIAADFIVVLHSSPGSIAEAHDFASFLHSVGSKMLLFVDERFRAGYSFKGALSELNHMYHNVEPYSYPIDIFECHLLAAVQRKVNILRHAKWRRSLA